MCVYTTDVCCITQGWTDTSSGLTEGQKEAKIKETLKSTAEQTVMSPMERRGPTREGVE